VVRLEAGEHEPSLAMLVKLSAALRVNVTLQINATGVWLRHSA
jgi:hypothetical protein